MIWLLIFSAVLSRRRSPPAAGRIAGFRHVWQRHSDLPPAIWVGDACGQIVIGRIERFSIIAWKPDYHSGRAGRCTSPAGEYGGVLGDARVAPIVCIRLRSQ
jgi:hypothetical protein